MLSNHLVRPSILCVFLTLILATANAQNNWIDPNNGNWSNPATRSLGTIPGPGEDVVINGLSTPAFYYVNLNPPQHEMDVSLRAPEKR